VFDKLLDPLDLIVHLRREDFVAQAVSLALAVETDVWHGRDVHERPLDEWHGQVPYDAAKVKAHARNILNQEYHWRRFIAETGAPALDLVYEEVAKDVDCAIRGIAEAFDLRLGSKPKPADAIRQGRSGAARAWCERFREECEDFVAFWTEYRGLITAA
jgi:LPS sulfotransferase NodH